MGFRRFRLKGWFRVEAPLKTGTPVSEYLGCWVHVCRASDAGLLGSGV